MSSKCSNNCDESNVAVVKGCVFTKMIRIFNNKTNPLEKIYAMIIDNGIFFYFRSSNS